MLGLGFKVFDDNKEKFKFIFCPGVQIGEFNLWFWSRPREAISSKFQLQDEAYFVYTYNEANDFWFVTTEDEIEVGKYYLFSYSALRPYTTKVIPPPVEKKRKRKKNKFEMKTY